LTPALKAIFFLLLMECFDPVAIFRNEGWQPCIVCVWVAQKVTLVGGETRIPEVLTKDSLVVFKVRDEDSVADFRCSFGGFGSIFKVRYEVFVGGF
jgi:hypothetical protein